MSPPHVVGQVLKDCADQNIQPFNNVIDFQEISRLIIVLRIITETITTTNSNTIYFILGLIMNSWLILTIN